MMRMAWFVVGGPGLGGAALTASFDFGEVRMKIGLIICDNPKLSNRANTGNGSLQHDLNEFHSTLFGELAAPGLTQIYGHGEFRDPQMVANGGYHVANPASIWIEDLPASRGLGILELVSDSFRNWVGDFGETHSITPLIDSLMVLDMLQQLEPDISMMTAIRMRWSDAANEEDRRLAA